MVKFNYKCLGVVERVKFVGHSPRPKFVQLELVVSMDYYEDIFWMSLFYKFILCLFSHCDAIAEVLLQNLCVQW